MKLYLIDKDGDRIKGGDEIWPWVVRKVSIPVAVRLKRMGVIPEMIVGLSFLFGILGGIGLATDRPVVGAILCLMSWFLDFVDGDLARKSRRDSKLGAFLDSVNGKLFSFFIFGGITIGYWREAMGTAWVWGFFLISGIYVSSSIKIKADALDPEILNFPAGLRHHGDYIERSAWKFLRAFVLSGLDFLLFYTLGMCLLKRMDFALIGATIYSWCYVFFNFAHGLRRVANPQEKQPIRALICYFGFYTGLFQFYLRFLRPQGEAAILMYHHVKENDEQDVQGVTRNRLNEQIDYLKKHFYICPLDEIVSAHQRKQQSPRNAIALTFDDGFEDFYTQAYPVLRKHKLPAIVYLVSHAVEHQVPIWTERIESIIKLSKNKVFELHLSGKRRNFSVQTEDEREEALTQIKSHLKMISDSERQQAMAQLDGAHTLPEGDASGNSRMLNWDQVREMKSHGIMFGAHTMTHPILTRLSEQDAMREICGSKEHIEKRLGEPVLDFCYPNGETSDFNERIKQIVKDAGFRSATTSIWGRNGRDQDPYALKRIYVTDEPLPFFMARICGVIQ